MCPASHEPWFHRVAAALPSRCAVCGAWPSQPVCRTCIATFVQALPRCRRCALPVPQGVEACGACLRKPPPLAACLVAVPYAYPWSGLITRFKFQSQPGWAATFARLLATHAQLPGVLGPADHVLPMPLAPERLAERGFNQALEIARRLHPARTDANLLLRVRATAPQASLSLRERQHNVKGAFAVDPLRAHELRGKHAVLVDDVMTSGASLHAAAQVLHEAGAGSVSALVFARTDEPG